MPGAMPMLVVGMFRKKRHMATLAWPWHPQLTANKHQSPIPNPQSLL